MLWRLMGWRVEWKAEGLWVEVSEVLGPGEVAQRRSRAVLLTSEGLGQYGKFRRLRRWMRWLTWWCLDPVRVVPQQGRQWPGPGLSKVREAAGRVLAPRRSLASWYSDVQVRGLPRALYGVVRVK